MPTIPRLATAALLLVLVATSTGLAADWPTYQRDGANRGTAAGTVPTADPTVKWTFGAAGSVVSSPAVVDGAVYVGSFDDSFWGMAKSHREGGMPYARNRTGHIYRLEADDGEVAWNASLTGSVWSSPAVVDGTVYIATMAGVVYALDADTGTVRWRHDAGHPIYAPPTVGDGRIYVGSRDFDAHSLSHESFPFLALDADDGDVVWSRELPEGVFGPAALDGDHVFVGGQNGTLYALDADDGRTAWSYEPPPATDRDDVLMRMAGITAAPTVANGTVYAGSYAGDAFAVDAATGEERWRFGTFAPVVTSPAVRDGTVFVGSYDSNLYALDAATGDQRWRYSTRERVSKSSPAVVDGTVLVGSVGGNMHAVNASDGTERWRYFTDEWVLGAPAVADGDVYFTSLNGVYAVEEAGPGPSPPQREDVVDEPDRDSAPQSDGADTGSGGDAEDDTPTGGPPAANIGFRFLGMSAEAIALIIVGLATVISGLMLLYRE